MHMHTFLYTAIVMMLRRFIPELNPWYKKRITTKLYKAVAKRKATAMNMPFQVYLSPL